MPIDRLLFGVIVCLATLGTSAAGFAAGSADECLVPSEIKMMNEGFWARYPSAEEFSRYAAVDMKITTNIVDVVEINSAQKTGRDRAAKLALFMANHPEHFSSFKSNHRSTYLYFVGNEHRAEMVKTSNEYPSGQCVSMFHFESDDKRCIAGQRVRALRLSFIKDFKKIELQGVQIAMENCE